ISSRVWRPANQAVISSTLFAQSCKASRMSFSYRARLYIPATPPLWPLNVVCYRLTNMWEKLAGAPEEIRTPDPRFVVCVVVGELSLNHSDLTRPLYRTSGLFSGL